MYRGPEDPELRSQWLTARRQVASAHHPDRGGDAKEFSRLLDELNQTFARREAEPQIDFDMGGSVSRWQPARRVVTRGRRAARRGVRRVRGRIPAGLPGAKRYVDL